MNVGDLCFQLKKTQVSDLLNTREGDTEAHAVVTVARKVGGPVRRTATDRVAAPAAAA